MKAKPGDEIMARLVVDEVVQCKNKTLYKIRCKNSLMSLLLDEKDISENMTEYLKILAEEHGEGIPESVKEVFDEV